MNVPLRARASPHSEGDSNSRHAGPAVHVDLTVANGLRGRNAHAPVVRDIGGRPQASRAECHVDIVGDLIGGLC